MDFLDLLKGNGITSSPTNMEPLTHPFAREGSKSFNFGNPGDFTSCVTESTLKLTLGLQRSSGVYANRTFILNGTCFSVHLAAARTRIFFRRPPDRSQDRVSQLRCILGVALL